ncbi:hypothetical protein [uncultured Methylobacterium sp.]|jgi:transposase|uniref:hypothetical protein n=1 Tax=uncultured Methylobacterium sp. TaxID=157278 RepID=UPI00261E5516|nr:hypothetical protein [uncultured Methylobacterium sp.]
MERPFSESATLARRITREVIGDDMPLGTWLQRTQTFDGEDAIRLVIVFPDSRAEEVTGEQLVTIMSRIKQELPSIGETRLPLVSFARAEDEPGLEDARFSASA